MRQGYRSVAAVENHMGKNSVHKLFSQKSKEKPCHDEWWSHVRVAPIETTMFTVGGTFTINVGQIKVRKVVCRTLKCRRHRRYSKAGRGLSDECRCQRWVRCDRPLWSVIQVIKEDLLCSWCRLIKMQLASAAIPLNFVHPNPMWSEAIDVGELGIWSTRKAPGTECTDRGMIQGWFKYGTSGHHSSGDIYPLTLDIQILIKSHRCHVADTVDLEARSSWKKWTCWWQECFAWFWTWWCGIWYLEPHS